MKPPSRYSPKTPKDVIQGLLSVDEIVKREWERSYRKDKDMTLDTLRLLLIISTDKKFPMYRLRNTLYVVEPEPEDGDFSEVNVMSFTADPFEVYMAITLTFLLSLNKTEGVEIVNVFDSDKSMFRAYNRIFKGAVELEHIKTGGTNLPYKTTIDLPLFISNIQEKQRAQGGV
jgi:hypothetical protein